MAELKILAVVAHCRDAFDMVGGTLANHTERGDHVTVAVLSSENYSDSLRLYDQIKEGKKRHTRENIDKESALHRAGMRKALSFLGIKDVRFVGFKGIIIKFDSGVAYRIAEIIQEVKPDILITHHPDENAGIGDHPAAGRASLDGAWLASTLHPKIKSPHTVAQVFFMCPPGETTRLDWEAVNRYPAIQIDVTRQVEKKLNALSCLKTQYANKRLAAKELEMMSGQAALHSRISYMEAFQNHRPEIYEYLPVSEATLNRVKMSGKEALDNVKLIAPYLPGVREEAAR